MADDPDSHSLDSGSEPDTPARSPSFAARVVALIEVLLCSDYPTQAALGVTLAAIGYTPYGADGQLRVSFVVTLSLVDTVMLVGLIVFFLVAHGERPRDVFLGSRPIAQEVSYGVPLGVRYGNWSAAIRLPSTRPNRSSTPLPAWSG